jgi:hypothetical protein
LAVESETIKCDHDLAAELTLAILSHIVSGEGAFYAMQMKAGF